MNKVMCALALALSQAPTVGQAEDLYRNHTYGFSIKAPEFPTNARLGVNVTPVTFQGAPKEGGVPMCNVQVQSNPWTQEQYKELSLNQFAVLNFSLSNQETRTISGKPAFLWRFGNEQAKAISLAVFHQDRVFLVSCMASAKLFAEVEPIFIATIESFSLADS